MTPAELLATVKALGVGVTLDQQDLVLRPKSKLTPDLVDQLREHKGELVEMLKAGHGTPLRDTMPGGVSESQPSLLVAEVVAMPLDDFASAGLVIEVQSEVLGGEAVLFASDNARLDPGERRVVYRAAEVRQLLGLRPADIRSVHRIKKGFGGTVIPS